MYLSIFMGHLQIPLGAHSGALIHLCRAGNTSSGGWQWSHSTTGSFPDGWYPKIIQNGLERMGKPWKTNGLGYRYFRKPPLRISSFLCVIGGFIPKNPKKTQVDPERAQNLDPSASWVLVESVVVCIGISGSQKGGTVPYKAVFCEDIPYIALI